MAPIIYLPSSMDSMHLPKIMENLNAQCAAGWPKEIHFDMSRLGFIRPSGVTFLSNLGYWLNGHGCQPVFININMNSAPIQFLDDSLFFEQHCGKKINPQSAPRSTTKPLQRISNEKIHAWLQFDLIPWISKCVDLNPASLSQFQVCVAEVFNNIGDHSIRDSGSIFAQHFPNEKQIIISVADFGPGIPSTVRRKVPDANDFDAVLQAVEPGFTSSSTPRNKGAGLDFLLNTVVGRNGGQVMILSSAASVVFVPNGTAIANQTLAVGGFCPGTLIDIRLRTDTIERVEDDQEDMTW